MKRTHFMRMAPGKPQGNDAKFDRRKNDGPSPRTKKGPQTMNQPLVGRRKLLLGAAAAAAAIITPIEAEAGKRLPARRMLSISNPHTGEKMRALYYSDGAYDRRAAMEFSKVLRDWRVGAVRQLHPYLMDIVSILHLTFRVNEVVVNSGYRTPQTNAKLEGAAKNSLHMRGLALDVTLPGIDSLAVAKALRAAIPGGVGYYPQKHFVHFDLGERRSWVG
jgi:uncharacterized protein YcbK (DUF882 family)